MNRSEWLAARRTGIGGTDAAAILGLSPWKSPLDVWLDKTGRAPAEELDPDREDLLFLGQVLEPAIASMYSRKTGRELVHVNGIVHHPKFPVIIGIPDRLVVGEPRGVELKSEHVFVDKFGDPGTDQVPDYYAVQCVQYMAIEDFHAWDIALLHGGAKFAIYTLERDLATETALIELLLKWWERHVVADVPPELDGSDSARRYVLEKFPKDELPMREATQEEMQLAAKLAFLRKQFDAVEVGEEES